MQSSAPISIDRCTAKVQRAAGYRLTEYVDFTNLGQTTATEVRFKFEIVDGMGRTANAVTGDQQGSFASEVPITHVSMDSPSTEMSQTLETMPDPVTIVCRVQMVRFSDGSVWEEGDGPSGSGATMYTPLPEPSAAATPPWRFPGQFPTQRP